MSDTPSDFFVAGGTLSDDVPSYVTRPADDDLLEQVQRGMFCYVLTSRQMGKSSLMVRTAQRLREQGITPVDIDLTEIGAVPLDEWYLGLITLIAERLDLATNVDAWWHDHQHIGTPQRFRNFLRDVALVETSGHMVVFIDEIDTTLQLDFRDDFFIAIRAMYNARTSDPIYERLTFVLLGVASPADLIHDQNHTPFNIGQAIALRDFTYAQAGVLCAGLEERYASQGDTILTRIFDWTHGQPFLTQKVCLAAIQQNTVENWNDPAVDDLVAATFFSDEGRKLAGVDTIQRAIQANPEAEQRKMLTLYRDILQGKSVASNDRSLTHTYLELYGLVRMEQGHLYARNRIYQHLCNQEWIAATLPATARNERRNALIALSSMIFVIAIAIVVARLTIQEPADIQAQTFGTICDNAPADASGDGQRLACLAGIFDAAPGYYDVYDDQARARFYQDFSPEQQKDLFLNAPADARGQVETVVRGISISLDTRTDEDSHDRSLMEAMISALWTTRSRDENLIAELEAWNRGRELARRGIHDLALRDYNEAIRLNDAHPVMRYDRAMVYVAQGEYSNALADLNRVLLIVEEQRAASALPTPTSTLTPTHTTPPSPEPAPSRSVSGVPEASTEPTQSLPTSLITVTPAPTLTTEPPATANVALHFLDHKAILDTVADTVFSHYGLRELLRTNQENAEYATLVRMPRIASYLAQPPTLVDCSNVADIPQTATDENGFRYIGQGLLLDEWRSYIACYDFGTRGPSFVVLHQTSIPSTSWAPYPSGMVWDHDEQGMSAQQIYGKRKGQLDEIADYFASNLGWDRGSHIFTDERWIWLYTPMDVQGIHAAAGNGFTSRGVEYYSIGIEMFGHFENVRPDGQQWENTKAVLGTLSQRLCVPPRELILFHRDFNKPTDPGAAVTDEWVLREVEAWLGDAPPLGTVCDPEVFPTDALAQLEAQGIISPRRRR